MADYIPRAFVTGFPVEHSRSPEIHRFWLEKMHLDGTYDAVRLPKDGFLDFINGIKSKKLGFVGGNITMPFKEQAFHLVDQCDHSAAKIGAVNTIYKKHDTLYGTNTDAYGFTANLDDLVANWRPKTSEQKKAIILGAGGASRAILYALIDVGFCEILLFNRTFERAKSLADEFGSPIIACQIEEIDEGLNNGDLFVNTSSLGMNGTKVPELKFSNMNNNALVTDIVYMPLKTPFLKNAEQQGLKTADGFGMLLHQAVPGFEHWFGKRPKVTKELRQTLLAQ